MPRQPPHRRAAGSTNAARARRSSLRRVGLPHRRLPARLVPAARDHAGRGLRRVLQPARCDYAALIPEVRRQFQRIRPESYRTVRGLEDGEDFDLNAVVDARVERRARQAPSAKLYVARQREERDVATLFLIDMSASTDEPLESRQRRAADHALDVLGGRDSPASSRRIIDVTKEALVIMAQALEEIGDAYAIYGFSGHGRDNVEFYLVKSFNEPLTTPVKGRIGAIEPKRSTRMGTALRHATAKTRGRQLALEAHHPAQRRLPAGPRLRPGPAQQRLRHPRHRRGAARSGGCRHHAVLHHRRQGGARLPARDVRRVALHGDRRRLRPAPRAAEDLPARRRRVRARPELRTPRGPQ